MDELYRYLGQWGMFQTRAFLFLGLAIASTGMLVMMSVILLHIPNHRCQLSGWGPGDTYAIQSEEHQLAINHSIPPDPDEPGGFSQCFIFTVAAPGNFTNGMTVTNATFSAADVSPNHLDNHSSSSSLLTHAYRPSQKCQAWVYDTSEVDTSVITQFDLVCDKKSYRAHMHMLLLIGTLFSSLLVGYLCDWFGRKTILCLSCLVCLGVGLASAFPPSVEVYLVYRFLGGVFANAIYMSAFVLVVELVGPLKRTRAASVLTIVWLIGPFLAVALSLVIGQWHYLQLFGALLLLPSLMYWWILPESPRWLLINRKLDAGMKILEKAARVNKLHFSPSPEAMAKLKAELEATKESGGLRLLHNIKQLFFSNCHMAVVSVIIFFNWFVVAMAFYGLSINAGNLGGNLRLNFFLSCTMELLGYVLAWILLERLGRKRSHCCFMLTAGLALMATIITVYVGGKDLQWMTTALAMLGKLGMSASFTAVYLISAEIFPTVIRNFAVAFSSAWGSVGDALSPYIVDMSLHIPGTFGQALPLALFGVLALLAGLSALYLPETLNHTLPDTIEEAVSFIKGGRLDRGADKEMAAGENCDEEDSKRTSLLMSSQTTYAL